MRSCSPGLSLLRWRIAGSGIPRSGVPAEFMPSRMGRSEDAPVRKKRVSQKELANKFRSVFTGLMAAQNGG